MTRPDLIAAVLADPEAVREVVEALRSGRVKVAGPWDENLRWAVGRYFYGDPIIAAECFLSSGHCECRVEGKSFRYKGDVPKARREIDARLRAAGWLLCGEGE